MRVESERVVLFTVCLLVTVLFPYEVLAQGRPGIRESLRVPDAGHIQIVDLRDGSTHIGRIVAVEGEEIRFQTDLGLLTIPIAQIKRFQEAPLSALKEGRYWFPNPNATRHFFGPTAFMLKEGEGYFADYYLFFPTVNYGVSDAVSLGAGVSIIPGVPLKDQLFQFTPKVRVFQSEKFNLAAGALIMGARWLSEDVGTVGILYGVGTLGTADLNCTIGLGFAFAGEDIADKPIVMLGGQARTGPRFGLVAESWLIPGAEIAPLIYGFRFMGEQLSVDLGFMNVLGEESGIFPGIPYVDFLVSF